MYKELLVRLPKRLSLFIFLSKLNKDKTFDIKGFRAVLYGNIQRRGFCAEYIAELYIYSLARLPKNIQLKKEVKQINLSNHRFFINEMLYMQLDK